MNVREYVKAQVENLGTIFDDQASRNLTALGPEVISQLQDEFWATLNSNVRERLVYVVWQFKEKSTIGFLIEVMDDVNDQTWMNALDGLVAIGGAEALIKLYEFAASLNPDDIRGAWTMEAIEQITAALG